MLRSNPDKVRAWQERSRKKARENKARKPAKRINHESKNRKLDNIAYELARKQFLEEHRTCPVTGGATEQIHHSAKREGSWLLIRRYWIAVSAEGHAIIEENKTWAEKAGLMVRVREDSTSHLSSLREQEVDIHKPVFYENWDGKKLLHPD